MSKIKTICLSVFMSIAFVASAMAQFQPTPSNPTRNPTYRASAVVTTAANATDIFNIRGSATRVITVTEIECSGIATTAGVANISVIRRSTANSGGTSTTMTNVPMSSSSAAATATVTSYTANPTVGNIVGNIGSKVVGLPLATGAGGGGVTWNFVNSGFTTPIVLQGTAQSISVSGNGVTLAPGATLGCTIAWTES